MQILMLFATCLKLACPGDCLSNGRTAKFSSDSKTNQNMDWEITLGVSSQVRRWMMQESPVAVEQEGFKHYIKRKLELNVLDGCFLWGSPREGTGDWGATLCPPWGIPDDKPGHVCLGKSIFTMSKKTKDVSITTPPSMTVAQPSMVQAPSGFCWSTVFLGQMTHILCGWKSTLCQISLSSFLQRHSYFCHTWTARQKSDW